MFNVILFRSNHVALKHPKKKNINRLKSSHLPLERTIKHHLLFFSPHANMVIHIFRNKQFSNLSGALSSNLEPKGDIFLALIQDLQVEE